MFLTQWGGGGSTDQPQPWPLQSSPSGTDEKDAASEVPCVVTVEGTAVAQRRGMWTRLGNHGGKIRDGGT